MNDIEAKEKLRSLLGPHAPEVAAQGLQAIGLLISNYGVFSGVQTNHWLGYPQDHPSPGATRVQDGWIPSYPSVEHGMGAFCEKLIPTLRGVLVSGDLGRLAWELLVTKTVPFEPNDQNWKILLEGLRVASRRVSSAYGQIYWQATGFEPPIVRTNWTHAEALSDLRRFASDDASDDVLVGLLAWACVASNYGTIGGQDTCNWAMIGRHGNRPEDGHALDETGSYLIKKMNPQEGIRLFVEHVSQVGSVFETSDIGALAMTMIEQNAMGTRIDNNENTWMGLCRSLRSAMDEIVEETGLEDRWTIKTLHPDAKARVLAKESKEQDATESTKTSDEKPKRSVVPWVIGGGVVLLGGFFAWKYLAKKEEPEREPITGKELLLLQGANSVESSP